MQQKLRKSKKIIGFYKMFVDFYMIFLVKLKDCPITKILTVSLKIISKPFSPIRVFQKSKSAKHFATALKN